MERSPPPDCGVAATALICQNEPEHPDDQPEVEMVSASPSLGVVCPECGRMAAGPDDEIPYGDPPNCETEDPLKAWIERNKSYLEGNPTDYARGYEACLNRLKGFLAERRERKRRALSTGTDHEGGAESLE